MGNHLLQSILGIAGLDVQGIALRSFRFVNSVLGILMLVRLRLLVGIDTTFSVDRRDGEAPSGRALD